MKMMNLLSGRAKAVIVMTLMLVCLASAFGESFDGYYDDAAVVNRNVTSMGIYRVSVNTEANEYMTLFYAQGERSPLACYNAKYQYWVYRRGFGYQDWVTPAFDMSQIDLTKIVTTVDSRIDLNRTGLDSTKLQPLPPLVDPSVCYDDAIIVNRNITSMGIYRVSVNTAENEYMTLFYAQGERSPLACYNAKYQHWVYRRGFGYQDWVTPAFDMSQIDLTKLYQKVDSRITLNRVFPEGVDKLTPLSEAGSAPAVQVITVPTIVTPVEEIVIVSTPDESGGWYDDAAEFNTSVTSMGQYTIWYDINAGQWAYAMISAPGDSVYIACYDLMHQFWSYRRGYSGYQVNTRPYFDMSKIDTTKFFNKVDKSITLDREVRDGETSLKPLSSKSKSTSLPNLTINGKTYDKTGFVTINGVTINGNGKDGAFISGRTVTLSPYIIGKYPVTQALYEAVMDSTPSYGKTSSLTAGEVQELRPVERVELFEVAEFCNKLSKLQGLEPAFIVNGNDIKIDITKNGWRVPTEAEWECAARGGNPNDTANWNNLYAGAANAKDAANYAWYKDNSGGNTHEVGLKKPNSLGLYDMIGNVFEWCADWYSNITTGTFTNPTGLSIGTDRVQRSIGRTSSLTDVTARDYGPQDKYYSDLGFRLCRTNTDVSVAIPVVTVVTPAVKMSTKDLVIESSGIYDSYPDYGTRSGGYVVLSGDVLTAYIPAGFKDRSSYWTNLSVKDTNVAKFKSSSMRGEDDVNGEVTFYSFTDYSFASSSFSWTIRDGDKIDVVYKDGSVKTLTTRFQYIPSLYNGIMADNNFRPQVSFAYKDPDDGYELKLSDIVFVTNECGAELDEIVKDNWSYENDPNGQGYIVYFKNVKRAGTVSITVNRNGVNGAWTRYDVSTYLYGNEANFSDIVINGKTYSKTGFAEVKTTSRTVNGSGKNGAFVNGRTVRFSHDYMIGKYAVTQDLYEAVMDSTPSSGKTSSLTAGEVQGLRPVERVDFFEVAEFCNKLSKLQGLDPVFTIGDTVTFDLSKNGWRLPTEAEWEFAARGGNPADTAVWNNIYAGGKDETDALNYVWMKENSNNVTHEVGLKKPNSLGLYDVLGNVLEWCLDWNATRERGDYTDPVGPATGDARVYRGGSKSDSVSSVNLLSRNSAAQTKYFNNLGFRLCRTLK